MNGLKGINLDINILKKKFLTSSSVSIAKRQGWQLFSVSSNVMADRYGRKGNANRLYS
jgi:hypothetical protein